MNRILPPLLALAILWPCAAQEPAPQPAPETRLLEQSREILRKLTGIEMLLRESQPASAPLPQTDAMMEQRLAALEAKLAEAAPAGASAASSAEPAPQAASAANLNVVWIVVAAVLVFFMQPGFCMLELGFTRAKNAINVCMKNFLDFAVGAITFLFLGFALMFGASVAGWSGAGPFWLSARPGTDAFWAFWLFQTMFAATAATILSGAMAERTKFVGYLVFTVVMTGLIYPIIGHWAWGSLGGGFGYGGAKGWLESMGYVDFAGSSVVHGVGGAAALAGILVLGPRLGRFRPDGSASLLAGHNLPMATLGTFILSL
ncbi:MAG: hypothetical protein N2322_01605, partial [Terrimicrobiaceae bacterium]|nr:hypothetical protein [Terrimicrobiaceae bacterium]